MKSQINVHHPERWTSAVGGAALLVWGARRLAQERHPFGAVLATTGAGLLWRSTRATRRDNTRTGLGGARGTIVEESVAINRSPVELYGFWRDLERLPVVMPELSSVRMVDHRRSHWVARGAWLHSTPRRFSGVDAVPLSRRRSPNELI